MLSLIDPAAMHAALPTLAPLPRHRVEDILNSQLADITHVLIIEPDDSEEDIIADIGFSPLQVEGVRYGEPGFRPAWDILHDHTGWFELVVCVGNDGFAFVLLVEDQEPPTQLVRMCRTYRRVGP